MDKSDVVITPSEEYAYGFIIKALAGGLYPNKFDVIREYIQNAFDAIVSWKKVKKDKNTLVKISIKKPSILIYDNGTGMDRYTLNEYRKVGFSKKKPGEFAGFRGIGKLAGISIAKKLIVTTSPYGVPEKYILVFDAEAMIKEIDELKNKKENIPLNTLIGKHTMLSSGPESKDEHYTLIDLQGIRDDSKILYDKKKLNNYISANVPVPFNPNFSYGKDIENDIKQFVDDYECIGITVDGLNIYKPYSLNLKKHQHIIVWDDKKKNMFAFCWYCEHNKKGQIKPGELSGLVYRYKNFAIGDNYLTRTTIWDTSAHLAFYFMGEIYVTDKGIMPTSQRDNFEHSKEREKFYKNAKIIASELNKLARESSDIRRAEEYIEKGNEIITVIKSDVESKDPALKDLAVEKMTQLFNIIDNIEKRKKNIPQESKITLKRAINVVKNAKKLIQILKDEKIQSEVDIAKILKLNEQSKLVYDTIVRTIKDFFINKPKDLEKLIKLLQKNLKTTISMKNV